MHDLEALHGSVDYSKQFPPPKPVHCRIPPPIDRDFFSLRSIDAFRSGPLGQYPWSLGLSRRNYLETQVPRSPNPYTHSIIVNNPCMNTRPLVSPRSGALNEDSRPFRLHHGTYPRTPLSSSGSESTDNRKGGNSAHVDRERDRRKGHKQEIDWNGEIFGMVEEPDTRKPKFSKQDILITNRYFHEVLLMKMPYLGEQLPRIGRESRRTFTEIEDIVSIALEVSSIRLLKKLLPQIFRGSEKMTLVEMLDVVSGDREVASTHPSPDYGSGHKVKHRFQTLNDISDQSSRPSSQPSSHPSLVSNQVDQQNSLKRKRPISQSYHQEYSPHSAPSATTKRLLPEQRVQTDCFEDRPYGPMANVAWHNLPDNGRVLDNLSKRAKHELSNDCQEEMTHVLPPQTSQPRTPGNHRLGSELQNQSIPP